jgi:hypothetical protein
VAATRKAAVWSLLSALAIFAATEFAPGFYPQWYFALGAIGNGLLLPVIASLHVRHAPARHSGAVLGTIAGASVAVLGLASASNGGLVLATLFVTGVWWWTIGKMWAETGLFPRSFGWLTMALALLCFAAVIVATPLALGVPQSLPALLLSPWLIVLGGLLWRAARLP